MLLPNGIGHRATSEFTTSDTEEVRVYQIFGNGTMEVFCPFNVSVSKNVKVIFPIYGFRLTIFRLFAEYVS